MKRKLSLLLSAALVLSFAFGCTSQTTGSSGSEAPSSVSGETDPRATVNLAVLSGPTGVGAAKLLSDNDAGTTLNHYNATVAAANDEVTAALIKGDVDIAAVATNVAANLSAKTDGEVQMLAVNTLGVLYILEKGDTVYSMADLRGKTIYAPSTAKGSNPEYILNYLLTQNGVEPSEVDIQWITAQEITAQIASSNSGICMLPVPAATALLVKDSGVRQAISLSDEWDNLGQGALTQGCIVARTEFVEENPQAVTDFLAEYEASIAYVADETNRDQASELVARYGITANAAISAKAIPQCNLTFITGQAMKDAVEQYFSVMFQAAPDSIGGAMPYDSFYYGVQ